MSTDKLNFTNGISATEASDASKKLDIQVKSTQAANTTVTLESNATENRTLTLPDATDTLATSTQVSTVQTNLDNHLNDATDAHDASAISNVPSGNLVATDVQSALNELQTSIDDHESALDPHPQYLEQSEADLLYDALGAGSAAASAAVTAHEAALDPHPQYLEQSEADLLYDALGAASTVQGNLDTHTSNTLNPHSTTKAQVGLTNVTDDAQLKRAANDFTTFTEKVTPVNDDIVLIEDSADTFIKKKLKLSNMIGGQGSINLIKDTNGSSLGAWTVYTGSGLSYPDSNDYNPSGATVTFATSSSSSMRGTTNFLFTHPSSNAGGEGFSYLCAIDPSDRGKVIRFNFEYLVASGTYSSGDLTVWFHDVTNNSYIQGAPTSILNSSLIERYQSEVQVPITCAQMRVLIHVSTSTATAYTMRFENFSFGPSEKLYAGQITDFKNEPLSAQPAFTREMKWRKVGDSAHVLYTATMTGPGDPTNIPLPPGMTIDTSKIKSEFLLSVYGTGMAFDLSTNAYFKIHAAYTNSTSLYAVYQSSVTGQVNGGNANVPFVWAAGDKLSVEYMAPILGWSSSSQVVSDDYTGRVVAASGYASVSTVSGTTGITNWAKTEDTVGMFNYSTGIGTIKTPGLYRLSATNVQNVGGAAGVNVISIFKGSTIISENHGYANGGVNGGASASVVAPFLVGDTFKFGNNGGYAISSANFHVELLSGSSQVLAGEIVASSYYLSANFTSSTTIPINFDTKEFDTHSAVTLRNIGLGIEWKFTAPVSGIYEIEGYLNTSAATLYFVVYKNGVAFKPLGVGYLSTQAAAYPSVKVELLAGQYIDIRANSGGSTVVGGAQNGTTTSYINITKV